MKNFAHKVLRVIVLFNMIFMFSGCRSSSVINDQAVETILSESSSEDEIMAAISGLEESGDWESLIHVLPPRGKYDAYTSAAIDAIANIGDKRSITYLKKVEETDQLISGQFWTKYHAALERLEKQAE